MKSNDPYFYFGGLHCEANTDILFCAFTLDIAATDTPPPPLHTDTHTRIFPERERERGERDRRTDGQTDRQTERGKMGEIAREGKITRKKERKKEYQQLRYHACTSKLYNNSS